MNIFLILLVTAIVAVVLFVIGVYNALQRLKTQIQASIQEIGNQLKRQASVIPNLESTVKSYLKHEKGIFELLATSRKSTKAAAASGDPAQIDTAIANVQELIPRIQVAVEDNPELKSNQAINNFMRELTDTADKLMYARRSLINLTQNYNQKLVMFPSSVIANLFGFTPEKGLEVASSGAHLQVNNDEMKDPTVTLDQ